MKNDREKERFVRRNVKQATKQYFYKKSQRKITFDFMEKFYQSNEYR
jgi:hypothetical protein